MSFYQQGDVLFHKEKIPDSEFNELKTNVIQHGEATGHAHRLQCDEFEFIQDKKTKQNYLRILKPAKITHEEHKTFDIPPGEYRIGIVREYNHFDEETRAVVD